MTKKNRRRYVVSRPAETVRAVANQALNDAVEIKLLIALMRAKNTRDLNKKLSEAGAGEAAKVVQNALVARLVMLIARAYASARHGDLHLRVATCLLNDGTTKQLFASAAQGAEKMAAFENQWIRCCGDHRLPLIKNFRDKFTAHLGEPKNIEEATYADLFAFGAETAKAMELLALATVVAVKPIDTDPGLVSSPEAFWAPWK